MDPPLETFGNQWESLKDLMTEEALHFEMIVKSHVNGRGWGETKKWLEGLGRARFEALEEADKVTFEA